MSGEGDDRLVERARSGDRRAFAALVERHYPAIHRFAWRCCGDRTEAEDVAQEALIRIARGLDGFEGRSRFSSWCLGVTLNCARDGRRASARRTAVLKKAAAMADIEVAADDAGETEEALWSAVRSLPDGQREAVLLVHVEGLTHREAAVALGCAEATVSWRLFAARRRLKSDLARSAA